MVANQRRPDDWPRLARWLHDHLDYDRIVFFTQQTAFNISARENPRREIRSYRAPRGRLVLPEGAGDHPTEHAGFPDFRGALTPTDAIPWQPEPFDLQPVARTHVYRSAPPQRARTQVIEGPRVSEDLFGR